MIQLNMQGRYRMMAYKLDGSERVLADWFENLILNNGLNQIESSGSMLSNVYVGSGTAAPAVGQTQLGNVVASTGNIEAITTGNELASGYGWRRLRFRFPQGQAAGNLSEVGIGAGPTNLFSRALILDGSGNPTTITVLGDEFLEITYEIRVYWPTSDATGTVNVNGVNTAFVVRPGFIGSWGATWLTANFGSGASWSVNAYGSNAALGPNTGDLSGTIVGANDNVSRVGSYSTGSYSRIFRLTFGLNSVQQSIGGMSLFSTGFSDMYFQCTFNPPIPKTNQNTFNADFTLTWARRSI